MLVNGQMGVYLSVRRSQNCTTICQFSESGVNFVCCQLAFVYKLCSSLALVTIELHVLHSVIPLPLYSIKIAGQSLGVKKFCLKQTSVQTWDALLNKFSMFSKRESIFYLCVSSDKFLDSLFMWTDCIATLHFIRNILAHFFVIETHKYFRLLHCSFFLCSKLQIFSQMHVCYEVFITKCERLSMNTLWNASVCT